jgi:glycogen debranching enzyme
MEQIDSLFRDFEYDPIENPDWGFARTVRATLLTPSTEWVQSVCSFPFEVNGKTFIAPNRDYPYEGLMAYHAGENWKFIDCVGLALQLQNGGQLPLTASKVRINPWRVEYSYVGRSGPDDDGELPVIVSYYLDSQNSPELLTGCVEFKFPRGLAYRDERVVPVVQPFVDIRHMYGSSAFENYRATSEFESHRRIHITNGNRVLTFFAAEGEVSIFDNAEITNWYYKLGTGSRRESFNSDLQREETVFHGEKKNVAAFFNLRAPALTEEESLTLYFSTSLNSTERVYSLPSISKNSEESKRKDYSDLQQIRDAFPLSETIDFPDEIWARIVAFTKFKTYIYFGETQKYVRVPHAGAWWFKTPWYRDLFEGLLNNFQTLIRLPQEREDVREIVLSALSLQDKTTGLILNKLSEFSTLPAAYNSCDATLLCFLVANEYFKNTKDVEFALAVLDCIGTAISRFEANGRRDALSFGVDGPPRFDELTGLLLCAPHHSWMDTRTSRIESTECTFDRLPNRLSIGFLEKLCEQAGGKGNPGVIASSPCFFLPEINAQWINVLAGTIQTIDLLSDQPRRPRLEELRAEAQACLQAAKKNFKSVFWNKDTGCLFNVVFEDGSIKDEIECEAGVTAAAMLGETVFSQDELQSIWECTKRSLLAHRRLVKYGDRVLPFGILTQNEPPKAFYGDDQYHSDVVWPRSTPYLIGLLRMLNENEIVREILVNNLDHQMTECAIFYNQELFSRALGNNAHPDGTTSQNPVPVKNPIQFWSQWCDAYLEVFGKKESRG